MSSTLRYAENPLAAMLLGRTLMMQEAMLKTAEGVAEAARDLAPVESGDYKAGIEPAMGLVEQEGTGVVATGRVNATDFKSGWVEFGTETENAHAPLRRGADARGLKLIPHHTYKS